MLGAALALLLLSSSLAIIALLIFRHLLNSDWEQRQAQRRREKRRRQREQERMQAIDHEYLEAIARESEYFADHPDQWPR